MKYIAAFSTSVRINSRYGYGSNNPPESFFGKIVTSLGELARSIACRFCCGNTLTLSSPEHVNIVYEKSGRNWSSITFPGAEQADVQQLLRVCSVASFAIGVEHKGDGNYHYAFELQPNQFTTSFQLCNTSILSEIRKLMMPDMCGSIQAELYKLNIYSGPGGHFKVHVDTPQSGQMFGSLVVCLPTQFSGGALVTRHQGREVRLTGPHLHRSQCRKCRGLPSSVM